MKKRIGCSILLLLLLLLGLVVGLFLVRRRVIFFPRAVEIGKVSLENSYVFASPLSAKAGDQEKIRVTVFVLDTEGKGVYGQRVFLGEDERLEITPVQAETDNLGRAIFDLAATAPAEYFVEARVGNRVLDQKVRVSFR